MIAIKDMEMPKRCIDCPIYRDWLFDLKYYCPFVGYIDLEDICSKRDELCPLMEIHLKQEDEEHG